MNTMYMIGNKGTCLVKPDHEWPGTLIVSGGNVVPQAGVGQLAKALRLGPVVMNDYRVHPDVFVLEVLPVGGGVAVLVAATRTLESLVGVPHPEAAVPPVPVIK